MWRCGAKCTRIAISLPPPSLFPSLPPSLPICPLSVVGAGPARFLGGNEELTFFRLKPSFLSHVSGAQYSDLNVHKEVRGSCSAQHRHDINRCESMGESTSSTPPEDDLKATAGHDDLKDAPGSINHILDFSPDAAKTSRSEPLSKVR